MGSYPSCAVQRCPSAGRILIEDDASGAGSEQRGNSSVLLERTRVLVQPALTGEGLVNKADAVAPCLAGIKGSV